MSINIDKPTLSALLSIFVAVIILVANFFQWWNLTYDGKMITKNWVKILFALCIILLIGSGLLLAGNR